MMRHVLQLLPNGDVIDWGNVIMSDGRYYYDRSARYYEGEHAEIMRMVLRMLREIRWACVHFSSVLFAMMACSAASILI